MRMSVFLMLTHHLIRLSFGGFVRVAIRFHRCLGHCQRPFKIPNHCSIAAFDVIARPNASITFLSFDLGAGFGLYLDRHYSDFAIALRMLHVNTILLNHLLQNCNFCLNSRLIFTNIQDSGYSSNIARHIPHSHSWSINGGGMFRYRTSFRQTKSTHYSRRPSHLYKYSIAIIRVVCVDCET